MEQVTPTICAKPVRPEELAGLLTALHDGGQFDYLIVSDWRDLHFVEFDKRDETWLAGSDSGRAFGLCAEVRWRRSEDGEEFLCRWISDGGPCPREGWKPPAAGEEQGPESPAPSAWCGWNSLPESEAKDLTADPEPVGYLLWGEPLQGEQEGQPIWIRDGNGPVWYTARIPRALTYPCPEELLRQWKTDGSDKQPLVLQVRQYQRGGQVYFERFVGLARYEGPPKGGN
jgi:hypothetical protein